MTKLEAIIYAIGMVNGGKEEVNKVELHDICTQFKGYALTKVNNRNFTSSRIALYDTNGRFEDIMYLCETEFDPHQMAVIFLNAYEMHAKRYKKKK